MQTNHHYTQLLLDINQASRKADMWLLGWLTRSS
jgi:hypothetical protein